MDWNSFIAGLIIGNFATLVAVGFVVAAINKESGPKF